MSTFMNIDISSLRIAAKNAKGREEKKDKIT
jgi:hypothetical protein